MLETSFFFLLFPQCFLPIRKVIYVFKLHLFRWLQMLSIWTSLKICCLVMSFMIRIKFNPFPHDQVLDETKLKAIAEDKCNKNDNFCL